MKKVGFYLILSFTTYLLGQFLWFLTVIFEKPIFGDKNLETFFLILVYTFFSVFGIISAIKLKTDFYLFKIEKYYDGNLIYLS